MKDYQRLWKTTSIGACCSYIQRGKSPKYTATSSLPVINQKCVRWSGILQQHLKYVHPEQFPQWSSERFIKPGDILWNSTGTGTLGRACRITSLDALTPKVVDSHVTILRHNPAIIDSRYLFYWIMGPEIQSMIEDMSSGTTNQIELNRSTIAQTEIPLAPLNEQKRISDKLEVLLGRVDACRERLELVPALLKRFRQSVLAAAVGGELTKAWRSESGSTDDFSDRNKGWYANWSMQSLGQIAGIIDPQPSHRTPPAVEDGVPYIGIGDVDKDGEIDMAGAKKVSWAVYEEHCNRYTIENGDFMFGKIGTLGRVTKLPVGTKYTISANVIVVKPNSALVSPEYLAFALESQPFMHEVELGSVATSQAAFGIKKMRNVLVAVPPREEQTRIVTQVKKLLALAGKVEERLAVALGQCRSTSPALLLKAFRGELLTQDPTDEPAAQLIQRIQASMDSDMFGKAERSKPRRKCSTAQVHLR